MKLIKVEEILNTMQQVFPAGEHEIRTDNLQQDMSCNLRTSTKEDQRIACHAFNKALSRERGEGYNCQVMFKCSYSYSMAIYIIMRTVNPTELCQNCIAPVTVDIQVSQSEHKYSNKIFEANCKYNLEDIKKKLIEGRQCLFENLENRTKRYIDILEKLGQATEQIEELKTRFHEILDE